MSRFEEYYRHQALGGGGGQYPVFAGARLQHGHGIGNILNSVARIFLPALKSAGKAVLKQGVQTGFDIAGDVLAGQPIKKAAKRRAKQAGSQLLSRASKTLFGEGLATTSIPPPAYKKKKKKRRTKPKKTIHHDIFA